MLDTIKGIKEYIKENVSLIKDDEHNTKYFNGIINSIDVATGMCGQDEEKIRRTYDAAVKWANQLTFLLWRREALTEEAEKFYRSLPTPESTSELAHELSAKRDERAKEITAEMDEVRAEQRAMDIFTAVLGGMTKEEAEKRQAEYESMINQAK